MRFMRQFRVEPRFPSTAAVDITWDIGAGYLRKIPATTQDVSRSGACLSTPIPFAIGYKLKVTSAEKTRIALVRRCIRQGRSYALGLLFDTPETSLDAG